MKVTINKVDEPTEEVKEKGNFFLKDSRMKGIQQILFFIK